MNLLPIFALLASSLTPPMIEHKRVADPPDPPDPMPPDDDMPDMAELRRRYHGYGPAPLNGGRTLEDIHRDHAAARERAKVRHRCRWCRGVCTGPMDPSPESGPFDLPPVRLEPEDGPYLWCDGCCMWLDAGGWHAYSPQFDAETKRQRRGGRNLWLVNRGGLQAAR